MEGDLRIHIDSVSMIVAACPTKRCILPLTSLDFLNRNVPFMQRVLFYSTPTTIEIYPGILEKLKSSLATLLVCFYPMAGRFTSGDVEKPRIDCNNAGIPFVEASTQSMCLNEFLASPSSMEFCSDLVYVQRSMVPDDPGLAFLSVQVTRFRSGGFSVGLAYNHLLVDGCSFWHFMKSWAETARGDPLTLLPVHTREISIQDTCLQPPSVSSLARYNAIAATASMEVPVGFTNVEQRMYTFSAQLIRKLKLHAVGADGVKEVSSFKVICAHIWRAIVGARSASSSEEREDTSRLFMGVDVRKRLELEDGYFGNAVCAVYAESKVGDLVDKGLSHGVKLVSEAIGGANDRNIKSMLNWCQQQGNVYFRGADFGKDHNYVVLSSHRFPVYSIDYGWGMPVAVRPGKLPWSGVLTFFAGVNGGDIDICICLPPQELDKLELDPNFLPSSSACPIAPPPFYTTMTAVTPLTCVI